MEGLSLFAYSGFLIFWVGFSAGLGNFFLSLLRLKIRDPIFRFPLVCGLGAWVFSQLLFLLGITGRLSRPVLLGLLVLLGIPFLFSLGELRALRKERWRPRTPYFFLTAAFSAYLLFYLASCLLGLFVPDMTYDSLTYHLYLPKLYLESGKIQFIPWIMMSAFPQNVELLNLLGLALGGDGFARVPNLFYTILCLMLFMSFEKELAAPKGTGLLSGVSFLAFPWVFYGTTRALVDIASAFYGGMTLLCLWKAREEKGKTYLILAGFLSAAGLGTKYLYGIHFGTLLLFWIFLWSASPKAKRPPLAQSILVFACPALFFGSFWYLRNLSELGNPFYPFAYRWFQGPFWSRELEEGLLLVRRQFGPPKTLLHFLILPYHFVKEGSGLFAFVPFFIFLRKRSFETARWLTVLFLLELAVWFFMLTYQMRYGMFWHLLFALLIGMLLAEGIANHSAFFRKGILFLLALVLLVSLRPVATVTVRGSRILLGKATREFYRDQFMESYAIFRYINTSLPSDAKIASFGDPRGFYCERPFFSIHPDVSGYLNLHSVQDPDSYRKRLRALGATHLMDNPRRHEIFRNRYPHWIALQKELTKRLKPVRREKNVILYAL